MLFEKRAEKLARFCFAALGNEKRERVKCNSYSQAMGAPHSLMCGAPQANEKYAHFDAKIPISTQRQILNLRPINTFIETDEKCLC
ncbi:MAG: hypothetical protein KY445_08720 [Armatimonadetes bacterium]|nr:hypothetical protein [Armatimonadota bacterium]